MAQSVLATAVRLGGLRAAPQLNGQRGVLELWDPSARRWKVRLISTGEIKSVKPENLAMEEEPVASRGPPGPSANGTAGEMLQVAQLRQSEDFVKRARARVPATERMDDSVELLVVPSGGDKKPTFSWTNGVAPMRKEREACRADLTAKKRITLMISTAVHNWHFTFKLLNNPGYEAKEDQRERMVRKEVFALRSWFRIQNCKLAQMGKLFARSYGLKDHHVDIKEEYPRYDMRLELHDGKSAFRHEGLLTLNNRPEVDVSVKDYSVTHALRPVRKVTGDVLMDISHLVRRQAAILRPVSRETGGAESYPAAWMVEKVEFMRFMTGHTRNFKANGQLFTDAEMSADHAVHELDLTNNALLTDKTIGLTVLSLGPLLAKLNNELLCAELQRLSLSSCRQAGRESVRRAIELTQTAGKLAYLTLGFLVKGSGKAIGQHKALHEVAIAGIGLGNNLALTTNCLDMLFVNKALQKLDLSWNRFCHEEFDQMGKLISQGCLQELSVDYCHMAAQHTGWLWIISEPCDVKLPQSFCSKVLQASPKLDIGLARDSTLKKLSLVANRIDFRSALVIEDALDMHPTLKVKNTFLEFDEEDEPRYRRSSSAPPRMLRIAPQDPPIQSQIAPEDPPIQSQIAPEDPPIQSQIVLEDPPIQSQIAPEDSPIQSQIAPEDPPIQSQIAPENPPIQSQIAPEDPPIQSQIAPEDPPIQSQSAPEDPPIQSKLNPDAPEFDFTGVSGETQFGSESYVYLPLSEYTAQEWFDYLYYLQADRVLLTPEYAAYICELTRLLGMPMMEHLDPQTIQVHPTGRPGSYLVKWFLDSRKLKSNDKQVISPGFMLHHPCTGQFLRFLIGAFPKDWSAANPEANFKKAEGRGFFQLKCDTQPKDQGCLPCRFGFSVSNEEMRITSSHFTESKCIVELPDADDAIFHVFGATGRDQLVEVTVVIEL
ncbi:S-antigen protein [Symbiodinium microadriaticum]|uniref:S-antigen protein n=1 Tax=Symbiodinium microadriaticum TaxID=2951 RepID=A0A1Q9D9V7_SYMMI|nr:S-antigen protein [Symbiodinium microadriaticum]